MKRSTFIIIPTTLVRSRNPGAEPMLFTGITEVADQLAKWGKPTESHRLDMHAFLEGQVSWPSGLWASFRYEQGGGADVLYVETPESD